MLNAGDIDYMQQAQDEMYTLRQRPITFIYEMVERDPITNIEIGVTETELATEAVVTEMTIRSKDGGRALVGGIEYEQGDIKIDVKVEAVEGIAELFTQAIYEGERYEILGNDRKGIGRRNRYEMLGRVIA